MRILAACVLLPLVLLAAPDDAAAKLRGAWASQYEWSESGVKNAALWFTYAYHWKGNEKDQEWRYEGRAQVVVAGGAIVRGHYPGLTENRRKQIESHVEWVVGRFGRKPFEEEFKDAEFDAPETTKDGLLRVGVKMPRSRRYLLLAGDRLAGEEWRVGAADPPEYNRMAYTTADLEDGYAVLGDEVTWVVEGRKSSTRRSLTLARAKEFPYPERYTHRHVSSFGTSEVSLRFLLPSVNAEQPVVGDPAARDALKAGWARRYVLPGDVRIEAQWHRRVDSDLAQLGWWDTVKGTLQVWGMDRINIALDERLFRDKSWKDEIKRPCEEHFRGLFYWLRDTPFDDEFDGCGFEFIETEDETVGVLVYGYRPALGFLLEEGRICGYRRNTAEEEAWWRFRLKKVRGDRMRIESMSAKLGKAQCKLGIRYKRLKGLDLPRSFEAIGGPRAGSREKSGHGVAEYSLKKLKVSVSG